MSAREKQVLNYNKYPFISFFFFIGKNEATLSLLKEDTIMYVGNPTKSIKII